MHTPGYGIRRELVDPSYRHLQYICASDSRNARRPSEPRLPFPSSNALRSPRTGEEAHLWSKNLPILRWRYARDDADVPSDSRNLQKYSSVPSSEYPALKRLHALRSAAFLCYPALPRRIGIIDSYIMGIAPPKLLTENMPWQLRQSRASCGPAKTRYPILCWEKLIDERVHWV